MSRLPNQTQESRNNRWACTLIAMSSFNLIALVSVCGGEVVRFTGDENNGAPIHQSFSNNRDDVTRRNAVWYCCTAAVMYSVLY